MRNSKLILLLTHFSTEDWRRFHEFVSSPYFNKRKDLVLFCSFLKKIAPDFSEKKLNKEKVFKAIYPNQTFDDKQLGYLMNYLLALAEKYLGWKKIEKEEIYLETQTLNSLAEFKVESHFQQRHKKTLKLLDENKSKNRNYFLNHFIIADISAREFDSRKKRTYNKHLQDASNFLNDFYFLNKLKYACIMIDWQYLINADYQIDFIDEVKKFLSQKTDINPKIEIYLLILNLLTDENPEPFFTKLTTFFKKHFSLLTLIEKKEIYFYAINFCARKIRSGEEKYVSDALDLYEDGINNEVLLEDNFLSPWTYTNVSKLALRLKRYDWVKQFIFQNKEKINPAYQENTFAYNLSELYYYTKDYDKALEYLNQVKFSDLQFHLGSRIILIKIYYETNQESSLLSLIASFSIFLKRNKNISNNLKKTYLNFCDILNQILRRNAKKSIAIRSKIDETPLLTDRKWLIDVWAKENPKLV